jgi:hypothetical protein
MENKNKEQVYIICKTRATQSVVYPLAYKLDPVALTFDLENQ